jgi:RNA polymerase sigma-70 factor, ECF subfamily
MAVQLVRPPTSATDDVGLVAQAVAGDEHAITALYKRHASHVAGLVYRMLGSDADLDDIVQETFVDGLRGLSSVKEPEKVRSFFVTIAVRKVHGRLSLRYRMKALAQSLFGVAPQVSDPGARAEVHALYDALAKVAPKKRIVWILHRVEGHTLPEVAEQSEISLATVKRWIAEVDEAVEAVDAAE